MARESSLTRSEKESLQITEFIFHIIIKGEPQPSYLDRVEISENQKRFFRDMLQKCAEGTQFVFQRPTDGVNALETQCKSLIEHPSKFVQSSKDIARDFQELHVGNVNNGAMIVCRFKINRNGNDLFLVGLLKVDHTEVMTFSTEVDEEGRKTAFLKEVKDNFVEHKDAVQKVAIVDVSKEYAWEVLATDKSKSAGLITDYFRDFLNVSARENSQVLTRRAVNTVVEWARDLAPDDFPEGESVADFRARANSYVENHDTFNTDSFLEMVLKDESPVRKQRNRDSLYDKLSIAGVAGQKFMLKSSYLRPGDKKTVLVTDMGVKVEFHGLKENRGIAFREDPNGKGYLIEIRSTKDPRRE